MVHTKVLKYCRKGLKHNFIVNTVKEGYHFGDVVDKNKFIN